MAVNDTVDAVGFDFVRRPELEYEAGISRRKGQLIEEGFIKIRTFRSEAFVREPMRKRANLESLSMVTKARIRGDRITDENRQKFWQALGTLRRKAAKRVVYKLTPQALVPISTSDRQNESCSAADLRRGSKTVFYPPGCELTLVEDQREFFREVEDEHGDFVRGRVGDRTFTAAWSCSATARSCGRAGTAGSGNRTRGRPARAATRSS